MFRDDEDLKRSFMSFEGMLSLLKTLFLIKVAPASNLLSVSVAAPSTSSDSPKEGSLINAFWVMPPPEVSCDMLWKEIFQLYVSGDILLTPVEDLADRLSIQDSMLGKCSKH